MIYVEKVHVHFTARISPVVIEVVVERAHVGNISELLIQGRGAMSTTSKTTYIPKVIDVAVAHVHFTARISPVVIEVAVERAHVGIISELMVQGRGAIPTANKTTHVYLSN
jgi:hypothetical protein